MSPDKVLANKACFLSQSQREDFYQQGYLTLPGLIKDDQLTPLREAMQRVIDRSRGVSESSSRLDLEAGHSAESPRLRRATFIDDDEPVLWQLCADSVITDVATDILGPDIRFRDLMANFKWAGGGAEVKWHQDIPFYPHTNVGTCQFLLMLEDVGIEQGPLQVIPGSHKGPIFDHRDESGNWTATILDHELAVAGVDNAVPLTGPAGTLTVHHSCTIHGSSQNQSDSGRPALVITYSAADAIPYTAAPYPSSHYGVLVRGEAAKYAAHQNVKIPLPPDWSGGYTSIFAHQHRDR
jgi:ectoine hydroxylase-related dioxygenase (phytanoyl-CoA dioxygenase family)